MASKEDKLLEFFQKQIRQSGYKLQTKVQKKLISNGYQVTREWPYLDKDELKGRAIDLFASKFIPDLSLFEENTKPIMGQLELTIECKSLPDHAWIFFEDVDDGFLLHDIVTIDSISMMKVSQDFVTIDLFPQLTHASNYDEIISSNKRNKGQSQQAGSKSNKKDKNLYEAICSVTKANRHAMDKFQKYKEFMVVNKNHAPRIVMFVIFQALIVFEGHLYAAKLENDDIQLNPIQYVKIPKNYVSDKYQENFGYIHVVSFNSLDGYLGLLHDYYWQKEDAILHSQAELNDIIGRVKWSSYDPFKPK
jgi:hypothetical protein